MSIKPTSASISCPTSIYPLLSPNPVLPPPTCPSQQLASTSIPLLGFLFKGFLMWTIFKDIMGFVTTLFLFYVSVFWPGGMWDLSSQPGVEPIRPTLEGEVLTAGSEVKSLSRVRLLVTPRTVAGTRLLRPWDFLGKSTGVGCHFLLQGIFPTQGSNSGFSHCRQTLYHPGKSLHPSFRLTA